MSELGTEIRWTGRPLVVGAVGRYDERVVQHWERRFPALKRVLNEPDVVLLSTSPLSPSGDEGGNRWPLDGFSASDGTCLASPSLTQSRRRVAVRTDPLAVHAVHYRVVDRAAYFAPRIDHLIRIVDEPMDVDWASWASTWHFTAPLASATPFVQIRRLQAGQALVWDRLLRRVSVGADSLSELPEPSGRGDVEGLADALQRAVTSAAASEEEVDSTLSGGWDSRLLALLLRSAGAGLATWTTSTDDGKGDDLDLAAAVADALGAHHTNVLPAASDWPWMVVDAARRLEYQSQQHAWLDFLAARLRAKGHLVFDGLGGDVLIKGIFVTQETLDLPPGPSRRAALGRTLGRPAPRQPMLGASGHAWAWDSFESSFAGASSPFAGHRNEEVLSVLVTRTARCTGLSPMSLFSPEAQVRVPFLAPDVVHQALAFGPGERLGGGNYRRLLEMLDPAVAALPSTNDDDRAPRPYPSLQGSPEVRRVILEGLLVASEVDGLLDGEFLRSLKGTGADLALARRDEWSVGRSWLRGLWLFGSWFDAHRDVLRPPVVPWR